MDVVYYYLMLSINIIIVTSIHEYSKALISTKFGDTRPKNCGSLTLNPLKHIEPFGFFMFLFFGYGWGKPVETSSLYYEDRKKQTLITYITPMVINLLLAIIVGILIRFISISNYYVRLFLQLFIQINVCVFVINLLPVAPFDGDKILMTCLSPNKAMKYSQYQSAIQMVVLILLVMGVLPRILNVITNTIISIL